MVRYNRRKACAKKAGVLQRTCKVGKVLVCTRCRGGCPHPAGTTFYNGMLPASLPFWTPKKEAKKVPATSDSAGGPAEGARPLGTPKRRSKKQKAKTCRSAARFLTLFTSSPIDPSGAKFHSTTYSVGADACHRPAPAGTYLRAGRRGGFHIRPQYTRNHRGVGDAAPYAPLTIGPVGMDLAPRARCLYCNFALPPTFP